MFEFVKNYLAELIASFALIQPWIFEFWKKRYPSTTVRIHKSGLLEVGFGSFGPTIGITGTLRALNKDAFVKSIEIVISKTSTGETHQFRWLAFRSPIIDILNPSEITANQPSSFLVTTNQPHRFNIIFHDEEVFQEINNLYRNFIYSLDPTIERIYQMKTDEKSQDTLESIIGDFRNTQEYQNMHDTLIRKCYWEPGEYRMSLSVNTSDPDKSFIENYSFNLSQENFENLKYNSEKILHDPILPHLEIPSREFNFIYTSY